ncbi:hypothetical protein [Ornithinimicrobium kibberense]
MRRTRPGRRPGLTRCGCASARCNGQGAPLSPGAARQRRGPRSGPERGRR